MTITDLLLDMDRLGASDLLLAAGKVPRYRIAGELQEKPELPRVVPAAAFETFLAEVLTPLATAGKPRDLDLGVSLTPDQRYRINFFYQRNQPALAARRVPSGALTIAELGLPPILQRLAECVRGLVIIAGATGSGKSTTMAAMLHHINSNYRRHIVTIEDPIEFVHKDLQSLVSQREVGSDTASFASALRHVVRQSPDAIFLGEMRDYETMAVAISAALTGHLVVTTVHTADVLQTVERIITNFPEHLRQQAALDLSLALAGVVAQRLGPNSDGSGRIAAVEALWMTPLARRTLAAGHFSELGDQMKTGEGEGMLTFTQSLARLVNAGKMQLPVAMRMATVPDELLLHVEGMETGIDTLRHLEDGAGTDQLTMKKLLHAAVRHTASDLLLSVGAPPKLRINGELLDLDSKSLESVDTRRLLFSVLSAGQRTRFETEREIDFALSVGLDERDGSSTERRRFRVNGFYQKGNVACALRTIGCDIPGAEQLGLPEAMLKMADRHGGLILVTGPTGHGKTTSLACLVDRINSQRQCHIITVEDPIEYVHHNKKALVEQREVYADTQSFAHALKYVLRQDPDVIMIGEMRDVETIAAALTAAETGHLVLATLHTNDARQTIDRIVDVFPGHQQNQIRSQLASALLGVFAQRLLPRADDSGRVAVFEVLVANTAIRALIRDGKTHQIVAMMDTCAREGMISLERAVENLQRSGMISRATMVALVGDR